MFFKNKGIALGINPTLVEESALDWPSRGLISTQILYDCDFLLGECMWNRSPWEQVFQSNQLFYQQTIPCDIEV